MATILTYAPLLLSVVLLQLSSGAAGPLDALSGYALGFTTPQIGLLGSAHYFGFFLGCWWAPRLTGRVGPSRAFAAMTATGAIALLLHMLWPDPTGWALMRVATGMSIAGCTTIVEGWLQGRVTNADRGRAMGVYRSVDLSAQLCGQAMIGILEPAAYASYSVLAIICCASLLPLALTGSTPPVASRPLRLRPGRAWALSPLAVAGVLVAGITGGAFRMVGPVFAREMGMGPDAIAAFLAAFIAGGALAQFPTGWAADRYDRRRVLIAVSALAAASSALTVAVGSGALALIGSVLLFGASIAPLYSVSTAHAHDFAEADERVELSAALLFYFAVGATGSPWAVSALVETRGPEALFWVAGGAHVVLIGFGLWRMTRRPSGPPRTRYVYMPRTTLIIGRLTKWMRDPK